MNTITVKSFDLFSVKGGLSIALGVDAATGVVKTTKLGADHTTLEARYTVSKTIPSVKSPLNSSSMSNRLPISIPRKKAI